jgi:hypothetical protein
MMRKTLALVAAVLASGLCPVAPAAADEGMWTFDNIPVEYLKRTYGFSPDKAWLDRIQKASVKLGEGCSGSVVSGEGLVLTNHHCVSRCVEDLSTPASDLMAQGVATAGKRDERICPGLEASILQSTTDVTTRVKNAGASGPSGEAEGRRAAEISRIESSACGEAVDKRCQVISLYRGGQYKLYVYDRYTDVRLAFAPERQAAFFGGDPDNFNFPRYAYDMALVRLYKDGKPARFADPLQLDPGGAKEGELVFTSGHPGSTDRLLTVAQLAFQRDHFLPWRIDYLAQLRGSLLTEGTKGEEEARQVGDALFGIENSVKVMKGQRGALVEPAFFAVKVAEEKRLRDALAADPTLRAKYGDPFGDIETLTAAQSSLWLPYQMLELRFGAGSSLLGDARTLVRGPVERAKPDDERLLEFTASRISRRERSLLAVSPVHAALERLEIEFWLLKTREYLGADHPAVKALFGARSAAEIAQDVVAGSRLDDPAVRKRLWENPAEVVASSDPAIVLAGKIDAASREARKAYQSRITGPLAAATERLAALRFDVLGDTIYPDATSSLRLSFGTVKGWKDPVHGQIAPFTYAGGLWERATGAYPFNLTAKWLGARSSVTQGMQMNLVSTNDIIGGNSGSPLLDRQGRIVGLVFDGNIHSLGGAFGFDPALNRTVSVSSQILVEGLRKVYGAMALADELQHKS